MSSRDFKMLPAPTFHQDPVVEPPLAVRAGQPPAPSAPPQTESEEATAVDFKVLYRVLVAYQKGARWWLNRDRVVVLRQWARILIKAFDLRVKDAVFAGVPLIKIEPMNVRSLGAYRAAADGYAIEGTIVFNEERLGDLPIYVQVALLLKFLLCAARHQAGGNGSFDKECRERMKAMGLAISEDGVITIAEGGSFRRLLEAAGIEFPAASEVPPPVRKGRTTLQVWSCTCQRCRVGTKAFFAHCPQCGQPFRIGDHVGKRFVDMDATTELART